MRYSKTKFKFLRLVWFILDLEAKKRIGVILLLILLGSFLEFIGLASIIPALVALKDPSIIYHNQFLGKLHKMLDLPSHSYFVLFLFLIVFLLFLVKSIVSVLIVRFNTLKIYEISTKLSRRVLNIIFLKSLVYFKSNNSSNLYRQINSYPTLFGSQIVLQFLNLISETVIITLILVSILLYNIKVFLIVLSLNIPIVYLFNLVYKKRIKILGESTNRETINLVRIFQNIVHGFVDIKMHEKDNFYIKSLTGTTQKVNQLTARSTILSLIPSRILELNAIFILIVIYSSSLFLATSDELIFTTISLFAVAAYKIMPSLSKIMQSILAIRNNTFALIFLYKILKVKSSIKENNEVIEFKKEIVISDVKLRYNNNYRLALDGMNLIIRKGEMIGIIGDSGSGKSSLINILLGFVSPTDGKLLVDNRIINSENVSSWRRHIGYVKQETFLFDSTIMENVALGFTIPEINVDSVNSSLERSHLTTFIRELKEGIYTHVGEMGGRVSGGQKQRLGIARALYSNPDVLILDEATSALDINTEKEIIREIGELKDQNKSIIIVAHRYSNLKNCDRIIRMDNGKIVKVYSNYQMLDEEIKL
jgi:ABC-type bacteriocin/lantibiotic exporter with double-glycine peptidase domain